MNNLIITGASGAGKSTTCHRLVEMLKSNDIDVGGVLTLGQEDRFFLLVKEGRTLTFQAGPGEVCVEVGKFKIHKKHLDLTCAAIFADLEASVLFIDEIGVLEQREQGYFNILKEALGKKKGGLVLVFRESVLKWFQSRFAALQSFSVSRIQRDDMTHRTQVLYDLLMDKPQIRR